MADNSLGNVTKHHPVLMMFLIIFAIVALDQLLSELHRIISELFDFALILIVGGLATGGGVYALARAKHPEHLEALLDKHTGRNQTPQTTKPKSVNIIEASLRDNPYRRRTSPPRDDRRRGPVNDPSRGV
jgi:hypothetical protein